MPTAAIQNGRPAADCPPAPVRVTKSLLGYGVVAGPFYVAASLAEALTRYGFSLAHNDWSLLANGALGWVHVLVLVLTGLMVAAAAGVVRQRRAERVNAASAGSSVSMPLAWSAPVCSSPTPLTASRSAPRPAPRSPRAGTGRCISSSAASASSA
jgi:Protein of unknown function (DUF998)